MTTVTQPIGGTAAETPAAKTPAQDAQEKIALLRAIAGDFADDPQAKPLTAAEIRLANATSLTFLEKAAVFADAAPNVGGELPTPVFRDAVAVELAYGSVKDEAETLIRRIETFVVRKKLVAVRAARGLYKVAKGYVTMDGGNPLTPHVLEMKRTIRRPQRAKKPATPVTPSGAPDKSQPQQ